MQSTPDRRLIERAKQGDAGAFEAVLAPVIDAAHRYACALLHDSDLAEDAVQEACVRAWRKLGRLRPGSAFLPWFLGIVARQCRDQMRGRWWRTVLTSQANPSESALAEETALRWVELREALMKLNERERQVLILRLYLDLPWSDVAAVAGVTEAGARTRFTGRRKGFALFWAPGRYRRERELVRSRAEGSPGRGLPTSTMAPV